MVLQIIITNLKNKKMIKIKTTPTPQFYKQKYLLN